MLRLRSAGARGHAQLDWLDTYHTFSFAQYHDPAHMGFRALRVINEDRVVPGRGFAPHTHADMEILTYVIAGALEHKDSMGTRSVIRAGEVQRMTAGTGITHSEYNPDQEAPAHFLQIWIQPERLGLPPGYEQRALDLTATPGAWRPVASPAPGGAGVHVHQDVEVHAAVLPPGATLAYAPRPGRHVWLQLVRGAAAVGGQSMVAGDGAAIGDESRIAVCASEDSEVLLFDLA